jgi:hypothetical protein
MAHSCEHGVETSDFTKAGNISLVEWLPVFKQGTLPISSIT